jgi:hypothetical protein
MDIWEENTFLRFVEVGNEAGADIRIFWGVGNHGDPCNCDFDGVNATLAHAFFPPPNLGAFAGDIHFDDAETWTLNLKISDSQPIDLISVAAHEIGHSLGLAHTAVPNSLMNATYTGSHRFLGPDDIAGIQDLYGLPVQISGPDYLCSTNTFNLQNLPTGNTVTWFVSNTRLFSGNTSGTGSSAILSPFHTNSSGQATITFTITTACGQITIPRTFWVGKPATPGPISGNTTPGPGSYTPYYINNFPQGASSIAWGLPYCVGCSQPWSFVSGQNDILITAQVGDSDGYVQAMGSNACGNGGASFLYVTTSGPCDPCPRLYPNPVSDLMTIDWVDDDGLVVGDKIDSYKVSLYNAVGAVIISETNNNPSIQLDLSRLKKISIFFILRGKMV